MSKQTVTINGTVYDAHTGMPIVNPQETPTELHEEKNKITKHDSHAIHQPLQKSQTLNRHSVTKATDTPQKTVAEQALARSSIQKSPSITKFAPHPTDIKSNNNKRFSDIGPMTHPMVTRAHTQLANKQLAPSTPKPAHVIKEEAISKALKDAPSKSQAAEEQRKERKYPRVLSIASATFALLLLGGYFTYLNMPSLSVRVAAAQAGINASYPEYRPDGYSLHGPVAYDQNEVMMKFAANAGPQNFTVTQAKSSWDSSAVLDNYVKQKAGDNYITYNERGLTIYTFDGNAAWVNGGILYTINGDAPLSTDQIRRIATSM